MFTGLARLARFARFAFLESLAFAACGLMLGTISAVGLRLGLSIALRLPIIIAALAFIAATFAAAYGLLAIAILSFAVLTLAILEIALLSIVLWALIGIACCGGALGLDWRVWRG